MEDRPRPALRMGHPELIGMTLCRRVLRRGWGEHAQTRKNIRKPSAQDIHCLGGEGGETLTTSRPSGGEWRRPRGDERDCRGKDGDESQQISRGDEAPLVQRRKDELHPESKERNETNKKEGRRS